MYVPFIITKDEVLWDVNCSSYSEIIKLYRLNYNDSKFVKVLIVPPNYNYKLPIEKWKYSVDRDQKYIPDWYNSEEAEKACRIELKHWYVEKVIKKGTHAFSGKMRKIILGGNVTINDLEWYSEVRIYGKSKVEINNMKSGYVWFNDNSSGTVNNQTGGDIRFLSNSTGTINNQLDGIATFYDTSTGNVNNQSDGYVWFYNNSTGTLNNQSGGSVEFYDNSTGKIKNRLGGSIYSTESVNIEYL